MSLLAELPDQTLWSSRTWPDFARASGGRGTVAILPLFGMADWGLGRPLDLEETLGTAVLRNALAQPQAARLPLLVLPPLRWVLGPYPHSHFGVDFETALDLLREIGVSVQAAKVRKLVLCNTSPWNEEIVDVAALDLRVDFGLQTYAINFQGLGLDLHPVRSGSRAPVQAAACACYESLPLDEHVHAEIQWSDFRPGCIKQPGSVPFDLSLDEARREGSRLITAAGKRLAGLLAEIVQHKPLPAGGKVPEVRPPPLRSGRSRGSSRGGRR